MKKSKLSTDSTNDKHYNATLYQLKLLAAILAEMTNLISEIKEQNILIKKVLSGHPLEEEPV